MVIFYPECSSIGEVQKSYYVDQNTGRSLFVPGLTIRRELTRLELTGLFKPMETKYSILA